MEKQKCEELYKEFKVLKTKINTVLQVKDVRQNNIDRTLPGVLSLVDLERCYQIANIIFDECKDCTHLDAQQLHELSFYKNQKNA